MLRKGGSFRDRRSISLRKPIHSDQWFRRPRSDHHIGPLKLERKSMVFRIIERPRARFTAASPSQSRSSAPRADNGRH